MADRQFHDTCQFLGDASEGQNAIQHVALMFVIEGPILGENPVSGFGNPPVVMRFGRFGLGRFLGLGFRA